MRLCLWLLPVLALLTPGRAIGGQSTTVPNGAGVQPAAPSGPPLAEAEADATGQLPVSLERIREGLARPSPTLLRGLDIKPDFVVYIQEREHIQAILNSLDFKLKGVIAPGGGLYGYEQQRMIGNKTSNPLGQPYAAFSGGELITLALQGLLQRYLGGKIVDKVSSARRSAAEQAAEHEVATAISEYCAAQPGRGESLQICRIEAMKP